MCISNTCKFVLNLCHPIAKEIRFEAFDERSSSFRIFEIPHLGIAWLGATKPPEPCKEMLPSVQASEQTGLGGDGISTVRMARE